MNDAKHLPALRRHRQLLNPIQAATSLSNYLLATGGHFDCTAAERSDFRITQYKFLKRLRERKAAKRVNAVRRVENWKDPHFEVGYLVLQNRRLIPVNGWHAVPDAAVDTFQLATSLS